MKRWLVLGLIGIVMAGLAAWTFARQEISERLFLAAIAQRVGTDPSAALPDGLHVYACGTGSPLPDADRAGPCLAVLAGRTGLVFDAGSGSVRKLGAMSFPMDRLDAAFLTHLHSDHIDGLGELLLQAWMAGRRGAPLPVHGPPGTGEVVSGFGAAYATDRGLRIAHHGPATARPGGFGGAAREFVPEDLEGAVVYAANGVTVTATRVPHEPVRHAYAYRIAYGGRAVVISGDLRYHPPLADFTRGADVLFHEALNPVLVGAIGRQAAKNGNRDVAKIMADIPSYHATPEQAAQIAQAAGARALVFYHVIPAPPAWILQPGFLGDAPGRFDGAMRIADDGLIVSLPARADSITYDQVL